MPSRSDTPLSRNDALACVPVKSVAVEEYAADDGTLVLSYPFAYRPIFQKIRRFVGRGTSPGFTRKVELDLLGAGVWQLIDGRNNVRTIIERFARAHSLDIKEAEVSVTLFLRSLGKKGLIGMG